MVMNVTVGYSRMDSGKIGAWLYQTDCLSSFIGWVDGWIAHTGCLSSFIGWMVDRLTLGIAFWSGLGACCWEGLGVTEGGEAPGQGCASCSPETRELEASSIRTSKTPKEDRGGPGATIVLEEAIGWQRGGRELMMWPLGRVRWETSGPTSPIWAGALRGW